jgi:hypothetical protein
MAGHDPTRGLTPPPPDTERGAVPDARPARALAEDPFGARADDPRAPAGSAAPSPKEKATDALGRRVGSLSDELGFPEFVSSLVHGTFDAILDASIRQMESFADLVAAVAKPLDQFARENVTPNQARDWLVQQYPGDVDLGRDGGEFRVVPRGKNGGDEPAAPAWLAEYGLADEDLTPELLEEKVVPLARERVARERMQTLATLVLLGMNRVVVRDGSITAGLIIRAGAADKTRVDYAVSDDPGGRGTEWGERGSRTFRLPATRVSTIGLNTQSESELKALMKGEVKINFASETVPLDRFADAASRALLERNAKSASQAPLRSEGSAPSASTPPAAPGEGR